MTCETATVLLHFARPGVAEDLAAEDRAALQAHLTGCPGCSAIANRHAAVDSAIAAGMKSVTVPSGLRDALQVQAISTQNAMLRAKWGQRLGLACSLMLAFALGVGAWQMLSKKPIDTEQMLASFERRGGSTAGFAFEDWRQSENLPDLPEQFNTQLMVFAGRMPLEGVQVPCIRLRSELGQEAVVYFLKTNRFDLRKAADAVGSHGGVKVYRDQPGGYTVIVVYSGFGLEPFFHNPQSAA